MLLGNKKEMDCDMCDTVDEFQKHSAVHTGADIKDYVWSVSI